MIEVTKHGPKAGSKHKNSKIRKFINQPGEAGFNKVYTSYKQNAKNRNREFSISKDVFRVLTKLPCSYCKAEPSTVSYQGGSKTSKYASERGAYTYNGLDRMDSDKGYVLGNVTPCCKICNRAKNSMHWVDFMNWISGIKERSR